MRGDHRNHAVDAAIIAMTLQYLLKIKQSFVDFEQQKENKNVKPQWKTIEEPWNGFSQQIAEEYKKLRVSHKAYNKQIAGYLHKDTIYGTAVVYEKDKKGDVKRDQDGKPKLKKGLYIKSIPTIGIKKNHLRMPNSWDKLKEEYKNATTKSERKTIRKIMLALEDVPPGKSGVIRDIELRDKICEWLKEHNFTDMEKAKAYIKENGLIINRTPVRKVRILWKLKEVKEIPRKRFDFETGKIVKEDNYKSLRVYQTQNNHHIEIREKKNKKGVVKWSGEVVTNFDAARRVRAEKKPIVDRRENKNGKFLMSLARGEMVHMRHPDTKEANYFVVFKIDSSKTIHFTPHTDANPASSKKEGVKLREDIPLVPDMLRQNIIFDENGVPEKVKISPLCEVKVLKLD